jgi:hypothetical protein
MDRARPHRHCRLDSCGYAKEGAMLISSALAAAAVFASAPAAAASSAAVRVLVVDGEGSNDLAREQVRAAVGVRLQVEPELDVHASTMRCAPAACLALARGERAALLVSAEVEHTPHGVSVTIRVTDVDSGEEVAIDRVAASSVDTVGAPAGAAAARVVAPLAQVALLRSQPGALRVCGDAESWSVCDESTRYSDDAFVKKYRRVTGAHDLDGLVDHASRGYATSALYIALATAGAAGATGVAVCARTTACGSDIHETMNQSPTGFTIPFSVSLIGLTIGAVQAVRTWPTDDERGRIEHRLARTDASRAADRYNVALATRARTFDGPALTDRSSVDNATSARTR